MGGWKGVRVASFKSLTSGSSLVTLKIITTTMNHLPQRDGEILQTVKYFIFVKYTLNAAWSLAAYIADSV